MSPLFGRGKRGGVTVHGETSHSGSPPPSDAPGESRTPREQREEYGYFFPPPEGDTGTKGHESYHLSLGWSEDLRDPFVQTSRLGLGETTVTGHEDCFRFPKPSVRHRGSWSSQEGRSKTSSFCLNNTGIQT